MNEKILTISIASYNAERYLDECISSLLNIKNVNNLDVIIVNDGSIDNTLKIANQYKNNYPNVIYVEDKKNGGWGSTVNASVKIAKGKYFKILDADDLYDTKNLDDFIDFLSKSDADIIRSPFQYFYKNDINNKKNADKNVIQMHRYTFKTDLLRDNNIFITENCYYTDIELTLKAIKYAKTYGDYDKNIYMYRVGLDSQSVSDASFMKNIDQHFIVLSNLIKYEYNDIKDKKVRLIFKDRLIEMIKRHYSILFKFVPNDEHKRKLIEFDDWLKNTNEDLYYDIDLYRVKKFRENHDNYIWLYFMLNIRSKIYNMVKR